MCGKEETAMEADKEIMTKEQLLTEMDRAWSDLQATIPGVEASDLTERTDPAGWSAKDHLTHLSAWANSVLVMIRDGRPQHEGLGIDEATYETDGYDFKNEVIRQTRAGMSLPEVQADLEHVYRELMRVLQGMSDEDLQKPCSAFVEGGQEFEIFHKISGNSWSHLDEHREYIERILAD
jgi:hypothetical protein